jgi:DNA-binding NarL/FixJ family response regulator
MSAAQLLTSREGQILDLIGRGFSTRRISESLKIEIATVRKHRENLMRKLDLHNTADIVLYTLLQKNGSIKVRRGFRRVVVTKPKK